MPAKIVILHSVEDAEHFVGGRPNADEWVVLTTNVTVNFYLSDLGMDSDYVSDAVPDDLTKAFFGQSDVAIERLVRKMDEIYSASICEKVGVDGVDVFSSIYRYITKVLNVGLLKIAHTLKTLNQRQRIDLCVVYAPHVDEFLCSANVLRALAGSALGRDVIIEVVDSRQAPVVSAGWVKRNANGLKAGLRHQLRRLHHFIQYARHGMAGEKSPDGSPSILLVGEPYDLAHVMSFLNAYDFSRVTNDGMVIRSGKLTDSRRASGSKLKRAALEEIFTKERQSLFGDGVTSMAVHDEIVAHFLDHYSSLLSPTVWCAHEIGRKKFDLVLWGNSPRWSSALLVNYMMSAKIPVMGMQHGGSYAYQNTDFLQYDSEYDFCDVFMSYGFDEDEVMSCDSARPLNCRIWPTGSPAAEKQMRSRPRVKNIPSNRVNYLFAITNTVGLCSESSRNSMDLARIQRRILETLNGFENCNVVCKPMPGEKVQSGLLFKRFSDLTNITFSYDPLLEFLTDHVVDTIVIDMPSTSLLQAVVEDVDVITMNQPVLPFTAKARPVLEKRVYIADTIDDMCELLVKHHNNLIAKLRDSTFGDHYYLRDGASAAVMQAIAKFSQREVLS